jgi:hypothetical protein
VIEGDCHGCKVCDLQEQARGYSIPPQGATRVVMAPDHLVHPRGAGLFIACLMNVISVLNACPNVQGSDVCRAGQAIGTKIGMGIVVFFCVDVLLGGLWVVTNTSNQICPVCGRDVENELLVCSGCGFDFAAPDGVQDPPAPPGLPG